MVHIFKVRLVGKFVGCVFPCYCFMLLILSRLRVNLANIKLSQAYMSNGKRAKESRQLIIIKIHWNLKWEGRT